MPPPPLPEEVRVCGENRTGLGGAILAVGVGGACAICGIPLVDRSIERSVVGFVLADMLLNVLGLERYDDDERDGEGDGGDVGGNGLIEASSSASASIRFERERDHVETPAPDERLSKSSSSSSTSSSLSLSKTLVTPLLNDISLEMRCKFDLPLTYPFSST